MCDFTKFKNYILDHQFGIQRYYPLNWTQIHRNKLNEGIFTCLSDIQ